MHAVTELTDHHEHTRAEPWHVTDLTGEFVTAQLRAIVGIGMQVEKFEAKAKLSQNRSELDQQGVIHGLRREPHLRSDPLITAAMEDR